MRVIQSTKLVDQTLIDGYLDSALCLTEYFIPCKKMNQMARQNLVDPGGQKGKKFTLVGHIYA